MRHRRLAAWFISLAQQLEAGLPFADALRASRGSGAPTKIIEAMATQIERGGSTDDAWRAAGAWLPLADQLALSAAADAGRTPITLRNLAARHTQVAAAQLRIVLACLYPLAVLHLGLLLLPITRMIDWQKGFHWSTAAYLQSLAWSLVPLWGATVVIGLLARRRHPAVMVIAQRLPGIGGYLRAQALADFAFALGNFLEAGVPIGQAWAAAGLISHSRDLKLAAESMHATITRGEPPGPRLAAWPCFPPDFVAQYRTGETTGQLEANLARLATQNQEAANRSLTLATILYPALLFLTVAGGVVYFVVSLYAAYLNSIVELTK